MKYLSKKKLYFFLYVVVVLIVILIGFNIYFTFQIHKQLSKVASQPGRWPVGAYVYDPGIGFDFAPNISGFIQDRSFYVKSHRLGYRIGKNEDASNFQDKGVLSLGCSFTYGDEVESEQTFTQLVADSLNIPAYNYGVSSFSYIHALLKAQKLKDEGILDQIKPEYVILGCWSGLLDRSRSPYPPLTGNMPLVAAHITKNEDGLNIHPAANFNDAFELIKLYRKEGPGMNFEKFRKIFVIAPSYVKMFLTMDRSKGASKNKTYNENVTDFEIYDFYLTEMEKVFSSYNTQIIVLYMPYRSFDIPDKALMEALALHPDIILVDGHEAVKRFNLKDREYISRHPQPEAHQAFAWETISNIDKQKPVDRNQ